MNLNRRVEEMNEFFDRIVDVDYDEKHLKMIKGKERVIDFLPSDVKNILDLGSGTGLQLIKLYKMYPSVHTKAIDVSKGMLKKLKEKNISENIEIINASFFDCEFGSNIDAVISTQALHHFDYHDKLVLFKKIYACLKQNGVFINEDYFAENDEAELQGFEDYNNLVRGEGKHYDTPLTIEHEIGLLKEAGFKEINDEITDSYKIIVARKCLKR